MEEYFIENKAKYMLFSVNHIMQKRITCQISNLDQFMLFVYFLIHFCHTLFKLFENVLLVSAVLSFCFPDLHLRLPR